MAFGNKILESLEQSWSITAPNIKAINQVIDSFFGNHEIVVAIMPDALKSNPRILSIISSNFKPQLVLSISAITNKTHFLKMNYFVIFFSSHDDFDYFISNFKFIPFHSEDTKFLIYVENCDLDFVYNGITKKSKLRDFRFHDELIYDFVYFLIDEEESIELSSVELFTDESCNDWQIMILNSFNKATQTWNKILENHEKFKNLNGCELRLAITRNRKKSCWGSIYEFDDSPYLSGIEPFVYELLSEKYNFTIKLCEGTENYCLSGVELKVDSIWSQKLVYTVPIFMESRDLILILSDEFALLEELLIPFNIISLMLLIVGFVIGICVAFAIIRITKVFQTDQVSKVRTIIGYFRILRMDYMKISVLLILFSCLVLRTLYQNEMFANFIVQKISPPETLDELSNRNYTIITTLSEITLQSYHGVSINKR